MVELKIPLSAPDITEAEIKAVVDVLKTPQLSLGPKLPEFERLIAKYIGVKHAIAVNSGTSALHLIVRSLGILEGDEVVTTPFSFIASANCILFERAKPVFVDIDPNTLNIDVSSIPSTPRLSSGLRASQHLVSSKTKAILAVDLFGLPADWPKLQQIAKKHNLRLIEDSCEALGSELNSQKAGTFADAACFAFYPNKQITTGEGGVIVTDDDEIAGLCRSMRNQGRQDNGGWLQHQRLGYNYRLSDINCALGIVQMKRITEILVKRDKVAAMYNERLKDVQGLKLLSSPSGTRRSWFVYVVILEDGYSQSDRDNILQKLQAKGIGCSDYFSPIHLQPFYAALGYKKGDFPVTEKIAQRTIALPFFNNLTEKQVDFVVSALKPLL
ncbi:MAG: DegT/DnrJ/EryC1/StrS family aminotransferase [Candidatus Margulisbacteria bacterium]|nr:DegT/DnrJ/EryC1/StrS family aminotransferase [Candidatus Margulisiibacteriota bacterium]